MTFYKKLKQVPQLIFCCLSLSLFSQTQDSVYHLKLENGLILNSPFLVEKTQTFSFLLENDTVFIEKNLIEYSKKVSKENLNLGLYVNVAKLKKEFSEIAVWDKLILNIDNQKHIIDASWGQRYKGKIIHLNNEALTLQTPSKMKLPFKLKEIKQIHIHGFVKNPNKELDLKKLNIQSKRQTVSPRRIFTSPTALPIIPNQIEYRASALFINEFTFNSGKSFSVSVGGIFYHPMLRAQFSFPIKKEIHLGFGGTATISPVLILTLGEAETEENIFGNYFGILTIGNSDRFVNFVYQSKREIYVPSFMTNPIITFGKGFAFGAGLKIAPRLQIITESIFYRIDDGRKAKKVNIGFRWDLGRHSFGGGLNAIDYEKEERGPFESPDDFPRILINLLYAARF